MAETLFLRQTTATVLALLAVGNAQGVARYNPTTAFGDFVDLPFLTRNAIVRVKDSTGIGSGSVIEIKADRTGNGGWLCVLTADHVVESDTGWAIGFRNGEAFGHAAALRFRAPIDPVSGLRPDLAILGVRVADLRTLPMMTAFTVGAPVRDGTLQAGYGDTGTVNPAGPRRYALVEEYGTYRNGHISGITELDYVGPTYAYRARRNALEFSPAMGRIEFGEAHTLPGDSGGPGLQKVGEEWSLLVSVHSESEVGAIIPVGSLSYDVRVGSYLPWIAQSCMAVPEPSLVVMMLPGLLIMLRRKKS